MSPERRKPQGPCPHLHPHFQTRDIMSSAALAARRAVASPSTQCSAPTQTLKHRVIATRRARDSRRASSASASASESAQLLRGRTVANKLADTSLFLIGIMGSGKSTVGASLAKALGYNHLDTDELIKSVTKKTPSELFAEAGESEFRAIESMILAEVAAYKRCVISTGGGIVCEKTNWMHLHNGVTVRLHGDSELLARRVLADGVEKRPLLSGDTSGEEQPTIDSIVAKINALLETRETMYKQADITVPLGARDDADGAPVDVVVDRLLTALEERVEADAVQNKLHNEPREGDITVTDPRGELGPRPERPGP